MRGWEAGFARWREAGEKKEKLRNIAQYFASKKNVKRVGTVIKGYEKREV